MDIILIGPYPPPIGGVSIHIQRLHAYLLRQGQNSTVYDLGGAGKKAQQVIPVKGLLSIFRRFTSSKAKIIHVHDYLWHRRAALLLFKLMMKSVIFSFHSFREDPNTFNVVLRLLLKVVTTFGDAFIATNSAIAEKLIGLGVDSAKITVVPAFIPPQAAEALTASVPGYVKAFLSEHSPIVAANAFRIVFHEGIDLYGLDMCVEVCAILQDDFPDIGFIFCLPNVGDPEYIQEIQARIQGASISAHFLIVSEEDMAFVPILAQTDLFVRPTTTDTSAISIDEALSLGVPVLASDSVERRPQVELFRNRNLDDFYTKLREMLKQPERKRKLGPDDQEGYDNNAEAIIRIYREVISGS